MASSRVGGYMDDSSEPGHDYFVDSLPVCVRELIAGGTAGAFTKTAIAPLERIKILLQTRSEGYRSIGVYQSFRRIVKYEGVRGLYRGNGASVIRIIPYSALHYMTYEQYRFWTLMNCPSIGTGPFVDLLAGAAAGGTAALFTYPLDLARTKLAFQVLDRRPNLGETINSSYFRFSSSRLRDVIRNTFREGGVRALYRGLGPTMVGILPYAGLKYFVYEELKLELPDEYTDSITMRLYCGALAGLFGQTFTYPLEVVRRQMQVDSLLKGTIRHESIIERISNIIRNHGWRQLYVGLSVNYIKVVPSVAIGFTAYDVMKSWLHYSSSGPPPRPPSPAAIN